MPVLMLTALGPVNPCAVHDPNNPTIPPAIDSTLEKMMSMSMFVHFLSSTCG